MIFNRDLHSAAEIPKQKCVTEFMVIDNVLQKLRSFCLHNLSPYLSAPNTLMYVQVYMEIFHFFLSILLINASVRIWILFSNGSLTSFLLRVQVVLLAGRSQD